jgi:DUF1680 family protein
MATARTNAAYETPWLFRVLGIWLCSPGLLAAAAPQAPLQPRHGWTEVPHQQVKLVDGFWGPRLKIHGEVTVPHALDELEKDGHVTNFDKAAGRFDGPLHGHHAFDSDLYKALEGALYSLAHTPDSDLSRRVNNIVDRILAAQQKDGFLISYFIVNGLDKRWDNLRLNHQMYNAGHFFEMAVEHRRLTGDAKALAAAQRFADHIDNLFGPSKRYDVDGHQEVELALIKLYRATGDKRYFELARFLLDERGHQHGMQRLPFDPATSPPPVRPDGPLNPEQRRAYFHAQLRWRNGRMQDHKPVVDQREAVGHAVRASYMYAAMADVARFSDAPEYQRSLDATWNDAIGRKIYITGGVGTGQYDDEGFGDPYLLPNESAYCESCAAIANVLWQHRMALLKQDARYADVMELSLYNGVLSGVALTGNRFFYQNPLATRHGHERRSWIGLSCCPTNLCRIIPQVGGLALAQAQGQIVVNLYMAGEARIELSDSVTLGLTTQTDYPSSGKIRLTLHLPKETEFGLALRVPCWAQGKPLPSDLYRFADARVTPPVVELNGQEMKPLPAPKQGYIHLRRRWKSGDVVELDLPMSVQRVYSHEKVVENHGKVALMRGPVVYCFEAHDQPDVNLFSLALSKGAPLRATHRPKVLGGVTIVDVSALADGKTPVAAAAIPYYAWSNRTPGPMTVWVVEAK